MASKTTPRKRRRSRNSSRRATAIGIKNDETWNSGDMEIITADNIRLRVPSSYLLSASVVFRDAGAAAFEKEPKIEFTDSDFETAFVLRCVFELVRDGYLSIIGPLTDANYTSEKKKPLELPPELGKLYTFLRKWDCQALLHTLQLNLKVAVERDMVNFASVFLVSAMGRDRVLTSYVLKTKYSWMWQQQTIDGQVTNRANATHTLGVAGASAWDVSREGLHFTLNCPPQYLWALQRAFRVCGPTVNLATKFLEYLDLAEEAV